MCIWNSKMIYEKSNKYKIHTIVLIKIIFYKKEVDLVRNTNF